MSARAAARLETLGFGQVYRYQAGKADWFAAGLPREGTAARTPRVADVARRDVPTCGLEERVAGVRDRIQKTDLDICVVVNEERVVLGQIRAEALDVDARTPVEEIMETAPITFRPNVGADQMPDYLRRQRRPRALVTSSDGILVGLLPVENAGERRDHAGT